ncbi:MAG: putative lipid II flippase FtsW ['Candidatus Kapabacteria' thiocyanatum]|uniref:Probable peptidoglycan glycosyltransferase FtsW n=1 Tax=Candidatus Kapaibacterium thiocyanatum TaxID=1895771 RepID=A0A1M3KZG7_9BACT|nr:putative lipid II flippase FtsW ['Candidatus Kapabacteria' thiocyanatum]OJX57951.1 MAG: cell division protein FtsW ['Candidatus Kapabacteria' thiocyanatum]
MKPAATSHIDWLILLPIAGLLMFSVAFVYSASSSFSAVKFGSSEQLFWNHALRVLIGLALMIGVAKLDYHAWQNMSMTIVIIAIGFLVMVLLMGTEIKGASRWVRLGPLNFQPSELAKYALVLHTAAVLSANRVFIKDWRKSLVPVLVWAVPICALIALQPNLSTASVVFTIVLVLMFLADVDMKHLGVIVLAGLVIGGAYAVSAEYRMRRLLAFVDSDRVDEAVKYQLDQALIAFGNGGITGVGPGQSRQRDWFLPESYGDFIFSIVGEEYGFLGIALLVGAFVLIMWRGYAVARKAPDSFGRLLAAGITTTLAIYAFVNAGVTCGILPTTGLPMPFISYGGSSVFFSAIAVGVLLNISSQAGVYRRQRAVAEG